MPDYQNGKIYMIESLEGNCVYYGSTVVSLARRLVGHRSDIKKKPNKNITSKEVLKYSDARILLVELYPCNSKTELEAKEATYIRNNDCVNKKIPQRTSKEFKKLYYETNKVDILEKCVEYRLTHKVEKKETDRLYRLNNKIAIKEHKSKKCLCDCGKEYTHNHYKRHLRTTQHINWENLYNFINN